mmetsp:Transcript_56130/g.149793  ORF Transcript_56130/g.149793 Transcript_56130/m.149793 type:complete len:213 (-) Transcript_56130:292-930(-)
MSGSADALFEVPWSISSQQQQNVACRGLLLLWMRQKRQWPLDAVTRIWSFLRLPPPVRCESFLHAQWLTREQEHAREVRILGDWKLSASICLEPADDNLVIDGRGHILDCDSEARFMTHAIQLGGERPSAETLLHVTLRNATLRFLWQIPSRDWSILYLECASLVLENVIFQIPGPLQWSNWVSGQDLQLQMKDVTVVATNLPSREPHTSWM